MEGVWELIVNNARETWVLDSLRPSPLPPTSFTMRITAAVGRNTARWRGAVHRIRARDDVQLFDVLLPNDVASFAVHLGHVSRPAADLSVYVLDCTQEARCLVRAKNERDDRAKVVGVTAPAAGRWVVAIDPVALPGGSTTYQLALACPTGHGVDRCAAAAQQLTPSRWRSAPSRRTPWSGSVWGR